MEPSFELGNLETRLADRGGRVTRRHAAAEEARPEQRIDRALEPVERCVLGANVLVEAQFTAWSDDAAQLGQRRAGVSDAAKNPDGEGGVEGSIGGRDGFGSPFDDIDLHHRFARPLSRDRSRRRIRLDGQDAFDPWWVYLEGPSVAAADLEHSP